MQILKEQRPMLMGDEERHNLLEGLSDIRYVRDFLNLVGEAERGRFDEMDWGYGDPTYMGGEQMEVFESQLRTVVYTLFGSERFADEDGKGLRTSLQHASIAMGEDELTGYLSRCGGGPVQAEYIDRIPPATIAEQLTAEAHPHAGPDPQPETGEGSPRRRTPRDGPGIGVAHVGLAKINACGYRVSSKPADEVEDVTGVEITGSAPAIADLEELIRSGCGEGDAPLIYRWRPDSAADRMLGANDALLMLCGEELYGIQPFFHDVIFARLLAAWSQLPKEQPSEGAIRG